MIGVIMSPTLSCDMSAGKPMEPALEVTGASGATPMKISAERAHVSPARG